MWQNSFKDELTKVAGVGWDLHGYHRDPDAVPKPSPEQIKAKATWKKEYDAHKEKRKKSVGDKPFWRTEERHRKILGDWNRDNPFVSSVPAANLPLDSWDYKQDSQIKTPFDRETNYKLNMSLDLESGLKLSPYTSDFAYAPKEDHVDRRLTRDELKEVVKLYKAEIPRYLTFEPEYADSYAPQLQAFVQKAEYLLKDPKMKFARLEYE